MGPVNQPPQRQAGKRIENRECEALQQTELGISQQQVPLYGFNQQAENHPIYKRENIGDE